MDAFAINQLLKIIEQQLDWGDANEWQSKDFENLNLLIFKKTKVSLSASTLRRIWGRVEYNHLPSTTTLDTLAGFAGFENWRVFTRQHKQAVHPANHENIGSPAPSKEKTNRGLNAILIVIIAIIIATLIAMYIRKQPAPVNGKAYSFSYKPVTRDIPNSVVFSYDAKTSPTDSVYIQQSWDPMTRTLVDRNRHQHTSVYYRPGSYHAKLVVDKQIVKELPLIIATNGWLGMIAHKPIPVYLNKSEFIKQDAMVLPVAAILKKNIELEPQPPIVEFYNVGNFTPVPLSDFSFSVEVKNGYYEGAATCRFMEVGLITDQVPIAIPLSAKGCVSELNLLDGHNMVSGKKTDFSGFGIESSEWVKVTCRSTASKIQYYVNDKLAYESVMPSKKMNIVGLAYTFQGTGSVRKIELKRANSVIFNAF
ncbi:hypothetical protein SNE25_12490 [Mucilaginibacter sabulilitoris]|uniref:PKD domain-containing protein n=1 Tax=Mucilaginibacter sabulilitoris TaxID=1173583 RepID=A0ABZ0TV44_9SPHI|nr:hypothetical protein [Mucilaginibacter sabulilitoris]WPU96337.1 hypothetical protein SNE25_12490 [Mucilaginibacter sabulilitoris]